MTTAPRLTPATKLPRKAAKVDLRKLRPRDFLSGPLTVTIDPGETTHNANNASGGFFYEIQVETNSQLIFPYAAAWPGASGDPIPGSVVKSAEFIRQLD